MVGILIILRLQFIDVKSDKIDSLWFKYLKLRSLIFRMPLQESFPSSIPNLILPFAMPFVSKLFCFRKMLLRLFNFNLLTRAWPSKSSLFQWALPSKLNEPFSKKLNPKLPLICFSSNLKWISLETAISDSEGSINILDIVQLVNIILEG